MFDLVRIRASAKLLSATAALIESLEDKPALPLPRFERLAESAFGRNYLVP